MSYVYSKLPAKRPSLLGWVTFAVLGFFVGFACVGLFIAIRDMQSAMPSAPVIVALLVAYLFLYFLLVVFPVSWWLSSVNYRGLKRFVRSNHVRLEEPDRLTLPEPFQAGKLNSKLMPRISRFWFSFIILYIIWRGYRLYAESTSPVENWLVGIVVIGCVLGLLFLARVLQFKKGEGLKLHWLPKEGLVSRVEPKLRVFITTLPGAGGRSLQLYLIGPYKQFKPGIFWKKLADFIYADTSILTPLMVFEATLDTTYPQVLVLSSYFELDENVPYKASGIYDEFTGLSPVIPPGLKRIEHEAKGLRIFAKNAADISVVLKLGPDYLHKLAAAGYALEIKGKSLKIFSNATNFEQQTLPPFISFSEATIDSLPGKPWKPEPVYSNRFIHYKSFIVGLAALLVLAALSASMLSWFNLASTNYYNQQDKNDYQAWVAAGKPDTDKTIDATAPIGSTATAGHVSMKVTRLQQLKSFAGSNAPEGQVFLAADVRFSNDSDNVLDVYSGSFEFKAADGTTYKGEDALFNSTLLTDQLKPGDTDEGMAVFTVPEQQAGNGSIQYTMQYDSFGGYSSGHLYYRFTFN